MPSSRDCEGRVALITGVAGQVGSYLADFLIPHGYKVHGLIPQRAMPNLRNIRHLLTNSSFFLHEGDITDLSSLRQVLRAVNPAEVFNLAAQSYVGNSWKLPQYTAEVTGMGALNVFESVRLECPAARIYQASSSEMFGLSPAPQNEETVFRPASPYAAAKVFAHHMAVNYRESYGMFVSCGIMFNCESPRRPEHFVTQKIATGAAKIAAGQASELRLGNLDARRDWGYAGDYVEAIWKIINHYKPGDFVIGTGENYSVRDFVEACFGELSLDSRDYVVQDEALFRPLDVPELRADARKIDQEIGWYPETRFESLVREMTRSAESLLRKGLPDD